MDEIFTGYCTNVHAGADLESNQANLQEHAVAVRNLVAPQGEMGVGLWLPAATAESLNQGRRTEEFAGWLAERGLAPYTLNGFPYGDFHQPVVKHRVYQPEWFDDRREAYTLTLVNVLHKLLPAGRQGSISTVPIAWGDPPLAAEKMQAAAASLVRVAEQLKQLEQETGRLIHLNIEPEPGCVLQRAADIVELFEKHLLPAGDEATVRRYLRVCHDVCHAAVMFEDQADVLASFRAAGIEVGKVQISSAVQLPLDDIAPDERGPAIAQLQAFAEDRYLHQTVIRNASGETFYEDLPAAISTAISQAGDASKLTGEWRVHFHVPVYLEAFGRLQTSRPQIIECMQAMRQHHPNCTHYEVETYAWGVLPAALQQPRLADGIAQELQWFESCLNG